MLSAFISRWDFRSSRAQPSNISFLFLFQLFNEILILLSVDEFYEWLLFWVLFENGAFKFYHVVIDVLSYHRFQHLNSVLIRKNVIRCCLVIILARYFLSIPIVGHAEVLNLLHCSLIQVPLFFVYFQLNLILNILRHSNFEFSLRRCYWAIRSYRKLAWIQNAITR